MIRGLRAAPPLELPRSVEVVLDRHREAVSTRVRDLDRTSLLDLAEPSATDLVLSAGRGEERLPTFEAVVSIASLPRFGDLDAAARGIHRLLVPGGVVHLVEPVLHVGATARLQATLWSASPSTRERHLERDVPLALRSNELLITDLERFTMPTRIRPLRRFIDARARRESPLGLFAGDVLAATDAGVAAV